MFKLKSKLNKKSSEKKSNKELTTRFKTFMSGCLHMSIMDLMKDHVSSKDDTSENKVTAHFNFVTKQMLPILSSTDALDATDMEKARAHEFNEKVMGQKTTYDRNRYLCKLEDKWHEKHVVKKLYHNIVNAQSNDD